MTRLPSRSPMDADSRMVWLDGLRLTAGLSMVVLHATADPSGGPWGDWPQTDRIGPIVLRTLVYSARTELFILISLFLLALSLDRRPRSYRAVIREQARRLLVPFLFWTAVFAAFNGVKAQAFGYTDGWLADLAAPGAWARALLLGEVKYHMHFLPTLFGLVLLYPLYMLARSKPALAILVLACLLAKRELDALVWSAFWGTEALPWVVRGVKLLAYAGYGFVAAAAAALWTDPDARTALRTYLPVIGHAAVLLLLIKTGGAFLTVTRGAWPWDYTAGYWADFLMPILLFVAAMALAHKRWPAVLSRLAPYSFGIYLCHPIFMDLTEIALRDTGWPPIAQVGTRAVSALALSSAFVWLLARSRALGWTIGLGPLPTFTGRQGARPLGAKET